jgi:hypothetical protein
MTALRDQEPALATPARSQRRNVQTKSAALRCTTSLLCVHVSPPGRPQRGKLDLQGHSSTVPLHGTAKAAAEQLVGGGLAERIQGRSGPS